MPSCKQCNLDFQIPDEDRVFYRKIKVPDPTLCPDCRTQRRWAWRCKNFFLRNCDKCGESKMAWFSPDIKNIKTYCEECYRSDEFEALKYGKDFDFNRTFFDLLLFFFILRVFLFTDQFFFGLFCLF